MLTELTAFLKKGTDEIIKVIDELFLKMKAALIVSSTVVNVKFIPIDVFFTAIRLSAKRAWIKELQKVGLQVVEIADNDFKFLYKNIEIFQGSKKEAKAALENYFKEAKQGGIQKYLDEIFESVNARKLALKKWIDKFDSGFYNHIKGEFSTNRIRRNTVIPYEDEYLVSQGGHTSEALGSTLRKKGKTIPNPPLNDQPYQAKIEIKYKDGWLEKDNISSMFPENWKQARIDEEIAYVYENTVAKGIGLKRNYNGIMDFEGLSSNGFEIRIQIKNDKIINAYPINF